jgi:hypothetical protein
LRCGGANQKPQEGEVKKYLTVAEAAPVWGLTEKALRQRIFRGQVPYRKFGKRVLIESIKNLGQTPDSGGTMGSLIVSP